jgi:hypothetical protein
MARIWTNLNGLTQSALILITAIALAFHLRWTRRNTALGPTFLTTLGIFFCFTGIAWGLLNFDTGDVRSSIPRLLEGIRTSFWASVAGIFWALTLKARMAIWGDARLSVTGNQQGATINDLAQHLATLNVSMAGSSESSLLNQIKGLRGDSNERLDRLNSSFERHAQQVVEAGTAALTHALQDIVRDFNNRISEQFGGNFSRLETAAENLVRWQAGYQQQLTQLIEQETATRRSMTEAAARFTELVDRSSAFAEVAKSLKQLMVALNTEKEQLNFALSTLAQLINQAATGLPFIDKHIGEMTRQIEQGVRVNQDALGAVLKTSVQSIQTYNQQLMALLKTTIETANRDLDSQLRAAVSRAEDARKQRSIS